MIIKIMFHYLLRRDSEFQLTQVCIIDNDIIAIPQTTHAVYAL